MDECKPLGSGGSAETIAAVEALLHADTTALDALAKVGPCSLTVLNPVLKAPMVSALEATIW